VPRAGWRVLVTADEQQVTVVALDTGEVMSGHLIRSDTMADSKRSYFAW
jgi:hypothetical protein